jgi:hypothetical protein
MTSIKTMLLQLEGLLGTKDLNDWEYNFVDSMMEKSQRGGVTATLSSKQVEVIGKIWSKHFA